MFPRIRSARQARPDAAAALCTPGAGQFAERSFAARAVAEAKAVAEESELPWARLGAWSLAEPEALRTRSRAERLEAAGEPVQLVVRPDAAAQRKRAASREASQPDVPVARVEQSTAEPAVVLVAQRQGPEARAEPEQLASALEVQPQVLRPPEAQPGAVEEEQPRFPSFG